MKISILILCLCLLGVSACVTPQYTKVREDGAELKAQDVNYKMSGVFHRDPPRCVAVLDDKSDKNRDINRALATAFARHLGEKVDRVIFPRKVHRLEQKSGYDLTTKKDRQRLALREKCRFYAMARQYDLGDEYAGVFARKYIGIKLDILRIEDDEPVWQAAHTVWRADGGVPLSPISAITGVASATAFRADPEILPSLIDDAMRRMLRTLPAYTEG